MAGRRGKRYRDLLARVDREREYSPAEAISLIKELQSASFPETVETHVRAPTPVGVFPEGDTPEGIADLTGNTYDLTSSLWGDDPLHPSWPYPYRADDGREAVDVPVTVSRVGRGGAWYLGEALDTE